MLKKAEIEAKNISVGYCGKTIVKETSATIPRGKISVIIGGNGCGKSTLLKSFARLLLPEAGQIILDGKDIQKTNSREVSQKLGLLPQTTLAPEGIKVADLVARGRFPYRKFMKNMTDEDYAAIEEAMRLMKIEDLAQRGIEELSGGQRQRVFIAMALAQDTDILLLDEPITYLDVAYQVEILDLLAEINAKKGTTICMVLHDMNLTARYADYIFAMKAGKIIKEGSATEVISPELLEEVFGLRSVVINDPVSNTPLIVPVGRQKIVEKSSCNPRELIAI